MRCCATSTPLGRYPGAAKPIPPKPHLIPNVLKVPLGQREKTLYHGTDYPTPDGTCIRDYIHIADLASAHVLAVEALRERPQLIYNVGAGRGYSIRELLSAAESVTGNLFWSKSRHAVRETRRVWWQIPAKFSANWVGKHTIRA
jgi:UDP-glucose 4-epimerase